MKTTYDLIAVGGSTEDVFFTVDDAVVIDNPSDPLRRKLIGFEYGAKIGITELASSCGGGASNVAVGAGQLGLKTAVITAVGNDERGKRIIDNFRRYRIDRHIETVRGGESGVSYIIIVPDREHIVFTYRGVNGLLRIGPAELKAIARAEWTYVTSFSGGWKKILPLVVRAARRLAWNPGREQLAAGYRTLKPYLAATHVLLVNRDEALELALSAGASADKPSLPSLARTVRSLGPELVVITDGARGALAFDGRRLYRQSALKPKRVVDTTGVGDAFGSSLISGLIAFKGDIRRSLGLAARNAASVIAKPGSQAGLLDKKIV